MLKAAFGFFLLVMLLPGCATLGGPPAGEELEARVADLERRVQEKELEIEDLREEIEDLDREIRATSFASHRQPLGSFKSMKSSAVSSASKNTIRVAASALEVQTTLKNSGYYAGPLDGKIGEGTQKAIKAFQQANGLSADGVVGQKTWEKLKAYLY